jgi:hypothetical protein
MAPLTSVIRREISASSEVPMPLEPESQVLSQRAWRDRMRPWLTPLAPASLLTGADAAARRQPYPAARGPASTKPKHSISSAPILASTS